MELDNLKNVVSAAGMIGSAIGEALENGKIGLEDISCLAKIFPALGKLSNVAWQEIYPAFASLNSDQQLELVETFKKDFELPSENLEIKIEGIMELVIKAVALIRVAQVLFEKNAKEPEAV